MPKKVKVHKPQHIYDPVFMINYYVSLGVSVTAYIKSVKKYLNIDIDESEFINSGGRASHFTNNKSGKEVIWIWVKNKSDMQSLVHEIFHGVFFTLEDRGIRLDYSSNEVFAYNIGMLMREILDYHKKKKRK